ncbi:hypothetical protein ACOZ4I_17340 (plasmid) [Haloarcula salina]|uniref:hypothetical protein n=1 Tax=Haloarcula salina TaxID=1429914 RepID=UPI003C705750
MPKRAESAIHNEIEEHWLEMLEREYLPSIYRDNSGTLHPANDSTADWGADEWGIYDIGVLVGLEQALVAVEDHDEGE